MSRSPAVYPTTVGRPVVPDEACTRASRLPRDRQHAEGRVVAEIVLDGHGKAGKIRELPEIIGMDTGGVEPSPVQRNVAIGVI